MKTEIKPVSVLFVRSDSVYKELGVDCWDIERDARNWPGGNPIVAHPPCRAWGKLKYFAKPREGEKALALYAVDQIRIFGGILEHPRHSSLWKEKPLPLPGEIDEFGGFSIVVDQFVFGHKAKKETLLYICGIPKSALPVIPSRFDAITHKVGYPKSWKGKSRYGIKEVSKKEREATPEPMARWLIEIAALCKQQNANLVS